MGLLVVIAGLLLTRPLWRGATPLAQRRRRANVAVYQTRVAEIDADLAAAALDAESAQQLRDEAAQRLLRDADAGTDAETTASPRRLRWTLAVIVLLALASGLFYWQADSWRTRELIALAQRDPAAAQQRMIDGMVEKLRAHLDAEPTDADGWAMLGRSYAVLQRFADSAQAYERANALSTDHPHVDWLVAAGAAHGMASEQHDLRASRPLFEQALALEPDNTEALWYGGLAAMQTGDDSAAYAYWLKLRDQDLPDDIRAVLEQQLPDMAAKAGQTLPPPVAATEATSLTVHVSLGEALKAQLKPGMRLLVFAKAENGPPMPLAVQRIETPELPLTVTLGDRDAMLPSMKMSGFANWIITARLTTGAGAQALSGDLEGSHAVARADAGRPLDLVIDRQLP